MRRPLRVLHVVSYFPPDRVGGVGMVAAHLHSGLLEAGHDSHVLTTGTSADDPRVHRVARTPAGFPFRSAFGFDLARRSDVVHFHHGDALSLMLFIRAWRVRMPVVTTFHVSARHIRRSFKPYVIDGVRIGRTFGTWRMRQVNGLVHTILDDLALWLSGSTTYISKSVARDIRPKDAEAANVIYNAVESTPVDDTTAVEPAELLFVGTFGLRKRVHVLPFLLERVRRKRRDVRLRVVGVDAREYPDLRRLFQDRGLGDAVLQEGAMDPKRVGPYYRAARILVVPSCYEGLPMVILEAFREGLPCVATQVSGHPEVIEDGVNGYLVPLDDIDAMAERCLRLLDDEALHATMAANAVATVRNRFSLRRQVEEYVKLYDRLAS